MFFDFFKDLSRGTLAFETKFGRPSPEMVSKVSEPCERSLTNSKTHHARAPPGLKSDDPHSNLAKNKFIPGSPGSRGSRPRTAARHLPSTRAGGQDDVSSQGNSLNIGVIK